MIMSLSKRLSSTLPINQADTGYKRYRLFFNFIGEFVPQDEFIPDKKEIPQDYF